MPSDDDDPLITIAEAARVVGINKSTLLRQVRAGLVRSHDGKVRVSEVIADRARNVDDSRAHRRKPETSSADVPPDAARPERVAKPVASRVASKVASRVARSDATFDATAAHATAPGSADDLITVAEAAREVGVNKSTLLRQVRSGAVRSHGGKVRLTEVLEDRARNIDLTKAKAGTAARPGKAARKPGTGDMIGDMVVEVDGKFLTFAQAQALKENYLAKLRKLEFEKKSGQVVDLDAAEQLFFDTAREERDAWMGWPARVSTVMAANLGVDERLLTEELTRHVHQHLAELGEPESPEFAAAP